MNKSEAINILLDNMWDAHFNANDYFAYACAQSVSITQDDIYWVLEHIEKHGQEGLNSAMAYVQNQEPIKPHLTNEFNIAIKELVDRKQEVRGDIDWNFHYYNDRGPYRTINKD